ncbi:MAG: hypothetical protein QHH24_07555 [Candidatus Bathyarchaeota archaeon]|nr:hypothetical protein [Candidatus Bathyarchaeota archaeon]
MRVESATLAVLTLCIFLAFYFAFLSFQISDEAVKKQFVLLAASSVITGAVLAACLAVFFSMKKAFSRVEIKLKPIEEQHDAEVE